MNKQEIIGRVREAYEYLMQDPEKWREENPNADKVSDFYPFACGYVAGMLSEILWDNDYEENHKETDPA